MAHPRVNVIWWGTGVTEWVHERGHLLWAGADFCRILGHNKPALPICGENHVEQRGQKRWRSANSKWEWRGREQAACSGYPSSKFSENFAEISAPYSLETKTIRSQASPHFIQAVQSRSTGGLLCKPTGRTKYSLYSAIVISEEIQHATCFYDKIVTICVEYVVLHHFGQSICYIK